MPTARRLAAALAIAAATAGLTACGSETTADTAEGALATTTPAENPSASAAAEPTPAAFETITDRDLKLIAKNTEEYKGRKIVVYGRVATTYADKDEETGADVIRIVAGATRDPDTWATDMLVAARGDELENIVEDDKVRVEVTVTGQKGTYTVMGVETSSPSVWVSGISLLES